MNVEVLKEEIARKKERVEEEREAFIQSGKYRRTCVLGLAASSAMLGEPSGEGAGTEEAAQRLCSHHGKHGAFQGTVVASLSCAHVLSFSFKRPH